MTIGRIILLSLLVLVVIAVAAARRKIQAWALAAKKFLREVRIEMQKVSWPTRNDVVANTIVVLVAVVALTVVITLWDQILSWIIQVILPGGGA